MTELDHPASADSDLLGRAELAANVLALIKSAPSSWTLRIGIYGRWGAGKTTVLRLIEEGAKDDALAVARFNPSSYKDAAELWGSLYLEIANALGAPKGSLSFGERVRWRLGLARAWVGRRSGLKGTLDVAGSIPASPDIQPILAAATRILSLTTDTFRAKVGISPAQIAYLLRKESSDKRLIVFVDDLDRTDPSLVPRFLLAIRELELPQAAFIVAIDPWVASQGLEVVHPGWKNAPEFLEKILQFHYWLTPAKREQVLRLALREAAETGMSIPEGVIREVAGEFPTNPRKLKEFFRSLWQLKAAILRHDADEIDWMLLLLIELLRSQAPVNVSLLLESDSFRKTLATSTFFSRTTRHEQQEKEESALIKELAEAFAKDSIGSQALTQAQSIIRKIADAPLTTSEVVQYWTNLRDHPPFATMKEAKRVLAEWLPDPSATALRRLIAASAVKARIPVSLHARGLFKEFLKLRRHHLGSAAEAESQEAMHAELIRADNILSLFDTLIRETKAFATPEYGFGAEEFVFLYQHAAQWSNFTHGVYAAIRAKELQLLLSAAADSADAAQTILTEFRIWDAHHTPLAEVTVLRAKLVDVLRPFVADQLLNRFGTPDGLSTLFGDTEHLLENYFLFSDEGGLYTAPFVANLKLLAVRAKSNLQIQKNFIGMFRAIGSGVARGRGTFVAGYDEIKAVASKVDLMQVIWEATIANPIQERILASIRPYRDAIGPLIGGVDKLPAPAWWDLPDEAPASAPPEADPGIPPEPGRNQ